MRRLLLGAALLTACGAPEAATREQQPIYAGSPAPDDTAVVGVVNFAGGQCSGSVLAPRLVLTARHCVADTAGKELEVVCGQTAFEPPDSPGAIFVVPQPEITDDPDDYVAVSEIRVPEGVGDDLCGTDVALLRLGRPLSKITPLVARTQAPVVPGESYSAVGFGADEALAGRPSGTRKRGDGYEVQCGGADCGDRDVRGNEWVGNGGPCNGDSGGPALDAEGRVIGVVSRGTGGCTTPIFSDIATRESWLARELSAATEPEPSSEQQGPEETCAFAGRARFGVLGSWSAAGLVLGWLRKRSRRARPRLRRS